MYTLCCLSCLPVIVLFLFMLMCRVHFTLPAGPPGNKGAGHQENYTYVHCVQFVSGPDDHCSAVYNDNPPLVGRVIVVSISSFALSALLYSTLFQSPLLCRTATGGPGSVHQDIHIYITRVWCGAGCFQCVLHGQIHVWGPGGTTGSLYVKCVKPCLYSLWCLWSRAFSAAADCWGMSGVQGPP